ncbi:MAG: ATP-grasp domain-containing protein, partial [Firmicutes bacterium]|nr:ATP-grasp domain-containing protein [Bacillota bacterium]
YLNPMAVLAAARAVGADAVHPGYGFLSEDADFAQQCLDGGFAFIGPQPAAMRSVASKAEARQAARSIGLPVVPGSEGLVSSVDEAVLVAGEIGYPVLIKASGGGGGRGMRVARNREELASLLDLTRLEAGASFGDDSVLLEKYLDRPRHVEVQILGDRFGNVVHLGERECSIQRRHQKLLEESPSTAVDDELRSRMGEDAVRLAREVGYENAGTVEFLLGGDGRYYFMEVNSRLQVEHGVTEMVTGVDIVKEQIGIAAGQPLSFQQSAIRANGWAIQCRINAEDPSRSFLPAPGVLRGLHLPGGPGVRVDTCAYEGWTIPPYYDSLVAKIITWGHDRDEAIARMSRALRETRIEGISTTVYLQISLLADEEFRQGRTDTGFLERRLGGHG